MTVSAAPARGAPATAVGRARVDEDGAPGAQPGRRVRARLAARPATCRSPGAAILFVEPAEGPQRRGGPTRRRPIRPHARRPGRGRGPPRADRLDAARPDAVARRRATGRHGAREPRRSARPGHLQRVRRSRSPRSGRRRSLDDLIANTPADGVVAGIGSVNAAEFGPSARAAWRWPTTTPCSPARRAR